MKFLRPRSADSGLVTALLVSDAELLALIDATTAALNDPVNPSKREESEWKKLRAELRTARKAL